MTPEEYQRTNALVYPLEAKLRETTRKFFRERRGIDDKIPEAMVGAANLYMLGAIINTASKEEAKKILEMNIEVLRNLLEVTPAHMFRGGSQLN